MKIRDILGEDYGGGTQVYGRGIRRGDHVRDIKTDEEYKVYGVEGAQIVINTAGDTLPSRRLKKINKPKDKLDELAPGGDGGGSFNQYQLWINWFKKLDSMLEQKFGVEVGPGKSGFDPTPGQMGKISNVSYHRVYTTPYYSATIEIKPETSSVGISTKAGVRFIANVGPPILRKIVYPHGEITVTDQVSRLVGSFEQLILKLNSETSIRSNSNDSLTEFARDGWGGDGGNNDKPFIINYVSPDGEEGYTQEFAPNEDIARDIFLRKYRGYKIKAVYPIGR